jgi:hypothetical protein
MTRVLPSGLPGPTVLLGGARGVILLVACVGQFGHDERRNLEGGLGKVAPMEVLMQPNTLTSGVIFIHSCPAAVCPHVEWALADAVGEPVTLTWTPQPALAGSFRAEVQWRGAPGTAARIASALRGWHYLRFEVTEHATPTSDGVRFMCTPDLGLHHSAVGMHGDLMVHEARLLSILERAGRAQVSVEAEIAGVLGMAWDEELEPFRQAGDGSPIRWLNQTG